jgi:hypothetical protein
MIWLQWNSHCKLIRLLRRVFCCYPRAASRRRSNIAGQTEYIVLDLRLDVSEDSASSVIVSPVNGLTKICIPLRRQSTSVQFILTQEDVGTHRDEGYSPSGYCSRRVRPSSSFPGGGQMLLVRGNTFLVLDPCLEIFDCIRGLERDRLSG